MQCSLINVSEQVCILFYCYSVFNVPPGIAQNSLTQQSPARIDSYSILKEVAKTDLFVFSTFQDHL